MNWFAFILKEWLLLIRDKIGLLILFLLPACLVVFISLTHAHNLDHQSSSAGFHLLIKNDDVGRLGKNVVKALRESKHFKLTVIGENNTQYTTLKSAKVAVAKGQFQGLLVIPKSTTETVQQFFGALTRGIVPRTHQPKEITLYLDPAMISGVASSLTLSINYVLKNLSYQLSLNVLSQARSVSLSGVNSSLFQLKDKYPGLSHTEVVKPNPVQQNVPAWSLFGMFFIVIPIAGNMVRERAEGVSQRLKVAPTSQFTLQATKILAFLTLNLVQLFVMLMVGVIVLPWLGLPRLNLFEHFGLVAVVGVAASLAATGFGILIGTWVNTYQQATVLGPFIVTILAAIGGIFQPSYLMPKAILAVSHFSPLYWAQSAFLDIFVRNADFMQLLPNLLKLIAFFALMLFFSLPPMTSIIAYRKTAG